MISKPWPRWIVALLLLASWLHAQPTQAAPHRKRAATELRRRAAKKPKPAAAESADIAGPPESAPLVAQQTIPVAPPAPAAQVTPESAPPVVPHIAAPAHDQETPLNSFELSLAGGILNRSYSYRGANASHGIAKPFEHELPAGPALFVDMAVYPLATASSRARGPASTYSSRILANLGLIGSFSALLGNEAVFLEGTADETRSRASIRDYNAGLRGRFVRPRYQLGLRAVYGRQSFDAEDVAVRGQTGALIPDIHYSYVQLAFDAKLQLSAWSIGALLGTRLVLDTGSLERDWCTVDKVHNLDLSLQLAISLTGYLELIATTGLSRYAITFGKSLPDSALVAEGAVDRYLSASLGLRLTIPVRKRVD